MRDKDGLVRRRAIIGVVLLVVLAGAGISYMRQPHPGDTGKLLITAGGEQAPYIEVAVDQSALRDLHAMLLETNERAQAEKYSRLIATHKLITVVPNTLIRIQVKTGDDCKVALLEGGNAGKDGWVSCSWITK